MWFFYKKGMTIYRHFAVIDSYFTIIKQLSLSVNDLYNFGFILLMLIS
jgi:hypothetical protein